MGRVLQMTEGGHCVSFFDYIKARQLILANASETIDKLEKEIAETGYYTISCKNDLIERIRKEVDSYKDDFSKSKYTHSELIEISMRMITTNSFELFEDDIYRVMGVVNWIGPAKNAIQIHKKMIKYALDHNLTTQEEADEDALALEQVINERM